MQKKAWDALWGKLGDYMTTSRLPADIIEQFSALLGSLARMVASGSKLSETELKVLLMGSDLEAEDPTVLGELERWGKILIAFKEHPSAEIRHASVEALKQRGLKEAPVLYAVDLVAKSTPTGKLKVRPDDLNFELPAGGG